MAEDALKDTNKNNNEEGVTVKTPPLLLISCLLWSHLLSVSSAPPW